MHKLSVGVLMGGASIEKEVSLNSGRTICDHLDTSRYSIIPIFLTTAGTLFILPARFLHRGKISDFEHRLEHEAQKITWDDLKNLVNILYIALHGRRAEDGTLQGLLEVLQIPYFGSKVLASALGMDKHIQKDFLQPANIHVPHGCIIYPHQITPEYIFKELATHNLVYPLVIKPHKEGSSFGISIVTKPEDLFDAVIKASQVTAGLHQAVIIEEKIEGLEFSCIIITDYKTGELKALPPTEVVLEAHAQIFDYDQKYMPGRAIKYTPARCTQEQILLIQSTCVNVMQTLGFTNLARIDGFLTHDNRVIITDPNTFSGMSPSSFVFLQAAQINISHTQLINHLIETELHTYGMLDGIINNSQENKKFMNTTKTRVAVLFGGRSNEREISLESGRNICYKLSPQKYDAIPLFVNSCLELYRIDHKLLVCNSTKEIEASLTADMKVLWSDLSKIADFVFIGLHGGEGENGSIQGTLEMLGLPYNGSSVLASALCMDKYKTNQFLKYKGFDVPAGILLSQEDQLPEIAQYPCIVKPHDDGCSVLVHKVENKQELVATLELLFNSGKTHALVEEYITGMELTVGVIGNDKPCAMPPSQAVATAGILSIEEKFLPGAGENQTPAPLPAQTLTLVQKTMESVYAALTCKGYARIDCFYQTADQSPTGSERVVILEVNTLPGMTPATCIFHQAAELGIKPMDFIDLIIQLGFEQHTQKPYLSPEQQELLSRL